MKYTKDQQRAANYIAEATQQTLGGGDDPVGFLIASHRAIGQERAWHRNLLREALARLPARGNFTLRRAIRQVIGE